MKWNELAEVVWNLKREYLEFDPKIEISFQGTEYGYGTIPRAFLIGQQPTLSELEACLTERECDIHSTQLRVVSVDGTTMGVRNVDWPSLDRLQAATECSKRSATIFMRRRYQGHVEKMISWQEAHELQISKKEVYLDAANPAAINTWTDAFDFTILVDGQQIAPDQFHWLPPAQGKVLEALLNMRESVLNTGEGLTRCNGFQALVGETVKWTAVVREFISRYGRLQAEALLGRDSLDQILAGRGEAFDLASAIAATPGQLSVAFPSAGED